MKTMRTMSGSSEQLGDGVGRIGGRGDDLDVADRIFVRGAASRQSSPRSTPGVERSRLRMGSASVTARPSAMRGTARRRSGSAAAIAVFDRFVQAREVANGVIRRRPRRRSPADVTPSA